MRKPNEGKEENQQEKIEENKIFKNYRKIIIIIIRKGSKTKQTTKFEKTTRKIEIFKPPKFYLKNRFK